MPILVYLWLLFLPLAAFAFNDSAIYRHYNYTLQNGLPFNNIRDIKQDNTGFIWIATENGLSRFDGKVFKNFSYDVSSPQGLLGNYVQTILIDKEGILWVSSRKGVSKYNSTTESFTHYPILASVKGQYKMDVGCISNSNDKNVLWISANGLGVYRFRKESGSFTRYTTQNLEGLRSNMVTAIFEDSQGLLWIGSQDAGLQVFTQHNKTLKPFYPIQSALNQKPFCRIHNIFEDPAGNIWVATDSGLFTYRRHSAKGQWITAQALGTPHNHYLSVACHNNKEFYLGILDGGAFHIHFEESTDHRIVIKKVSRVDENDSKPDGLHRRSITSLFFDRDENLWVGSYGDGVFLIAKPIYPFFNLHENQLNLVNKADQNVRFYGLLEDVAGNLFIGTDGHGIFKLDYENKLLKHYKKEKNRSSSLSDNAILATLKDHNNQLWFGTYRGGLMRYNTRQDNFTHFKADPTKEGTLGSNDVRIIFEDMRHQLWVGTNGGGLNKLNYSTQKFTTFVPQNSTIPSNDIRSIVEDKHGNLIIGTYGAGITYFEQEKELFHPFFPEGGIFDKLKSEVIYDLAILHDGHLWIATESNGLLVYDMEKKHFVHNFHERNGLVSNTVLAIQQDNQGHCWVSTIQGLSSIDLTSKAITNYGANSGVQEGTFNPRAAIYSEKRNQLFFAGTGGLTYFNPKNVNYQQPQRSIILTGLDLLGKEITSYPNRLIAAQEQSLNDKKKLTLPYNYSTFTLHYASLTYGQSGQHRFAYKLDGLDERWNYVGNEQAATYRYLPPGNYTFQVALEQGGQILKSSIKQLHLEILPPWYKTWWAYIIYFILAGAILYYYRRHQLQKQKLNYQLKISQLERTKEQEINALKINYYTRLSHEFRSSLTLILQPVKELLNKKDANSDQDPSVKTLYVNTNRLLRLANQALTFRKDNLTKENLQIQSTDLVNLILEVLNCFNHQVKQKNLSVTFHTQFDELFLLIDREKIEMVLFNLVFNAIKFTKEGILEIKLAKLDQMTILLSIKDSGCGIDKQIGEKLFEPFAHHESFNKSTLGSGFGVGLWMVKSLIELHDGRIYYESELGKGTTFYMELPMKASATSTSSVQLNPGSIPTVLQLMEQENKPPLPMTAKATSFYKILIIDDDVSLTNYLESMLSNYFEVYVQHEISGAYRLLDDNLPDLILCDIVMEGSNGIEFCKEVKTDPSRRHIPIILLTASHNTETKLEGIQSGADDYITKPFDIDVLIAKIQAIIKSRSDLKDYFFHHITDNAKFQKISSEDRELHDKCLLIIEKHLTDPSFNVHKLADACGFTYATLGNRIKEIHNLSLNSFIRTVRLDIAARLFLSSENTIYEVAYQVGIRDLKYFREQFAKQYGMNPSEYIKKYRKPFHRVYHAK
ncbi:MULTISPECIES: hybrid sensor histidine kinase/response regulator transcription factor [Olivibacter]|uniref:histidine kinase n=1 Tax=Olivibacter jilunii TaxID=985016 RepID=A0ABW6B869_9SPHI|nr:ATP-binding protein [Olivibacter sp. UJ_SKK_5.1]MDX3912818.1 two-component regulator propeller domain-containing protein [Pseudosphingobacterium sp.]